MKKKKQALHGFERITHKTIPYLLVLLLIIIIIDNPFWILIDLHQYETALTIFDALVIFFFATDLIYKWKKIRKIKTFIKLYWIDLIAVFPFYLGFRIYEEVSIIFRTGEKITETAQMIVHETMLLKETELLKEAELSREAKPFIRVVNALQRFFRLLKARFYITYHVMMGHHKEEKK